MKSFLASIIGILILTSRLLKFKLPKPILHFLFRNKFSHKIVYNILYLWGWYQTDCWKKTKEYKQLSPVKKAWLREQVGRHLENLDGIESYINTRLESKLAGRSL